jgi:hypothetical protein
VWLLQNESFVAEVRDHVCKIPLVTKVLDCDQLSDSEASRNNSIRHTIPGIVFALSENPDTVDEVLDILQDIEKDLFAIQESTKEATIVPINHLMNLTSVLEADLLDWEDGKDNLLDTIQTKISPLRPDHNYQTVLNQFHKAITRDLDDIAKSLQLTQIAKLNAAMNTWSLLLQDTPLELPWSDAGSQEDTSTLDQLSLLKRLALWSIPFTTTTTPRDAKPLTTAERTKLIHDKVLAVIPLLRAMHVSDSKAHLSMTTARNLLQRRRSWLGRLMGLVGGRNQVFDQDLLDGLLEMKSLVPMLMEQRSKQRVVRRYMRSLARAREDAKGPAEDL